MLVSQKKTTSISEDAAMVSPQVEESMGTALGTFKGNLPCADCSALETELTLTQKDAATAEGTYTLTETYVGKGDPLTSTGEWTTVRGTPTDADAVVYELNPDNPAEVQYYLKVSDTELKMLDNDKNEIQGPFNYILTKV